MEGVGETRRTFDFILGKLLGVEGCYLGHCDGCADNQSGPRHHSYDFISWFGSHTVAEKICRVLLGEDMVLVISMDYVLDGSHLVGNKSL